MLVFQSINTELITILLLHLTQESFISSNNNVHKIL